MLSIISSSPGELRPVFDAILENATRICEAKFGTLFLREGDLFQAAALHNAPPAFAEMRKRQPVRPGPKTALSRVLRTKQAVHIPDFTAEEAYLERDPLMVTAVDVLFAHRGCFFSLRRIIACRSCLLTSPPAPPLQPAEGRWQGV